MKVLIYWFGGFDTPSPSNHLLESLIYDMLDENIKVHLIQGSIKEKNPEIPNKMLKYEGFSYDTIKRKDINKKRFVSRYLEEIFYILRTSKFIKKQSDSDLIFVRSSPTSVYSILLNKHLLKKPVIYGVQDMWPGSAVASGVLKSKFLKNIFEKIQKIAYKHSDMITAISEDMKIKLIEQGVEPEKIEVIYNWYDDQAIEEIPWEENKIVKKYNLNKKNFYVQYAGTMGFVFDYNKIINAAKELSDHPEIRFQMIGEGSQKKEFVKKTKDNKLKNIDFYPLEPSELVPHVYSACDICVIPLKKGVIGNSVPSKAGLLMACKRPILNSVDKESHYYSIFNNNDIGISVSNDDPNAFAKAIYKMYLNREDTVAKGKRAYEYGHIEYSRTKNTRKFIDLFKNMIKEEV